MTDMKIESPSGRTFLVTRGNAGIHYTIVERDGRKIPHLFQDIDEAKDVLAFDLDAEHDKIQSYGFA